MSRGEEEEEREDEWDLNNVDDSDLGSWEREARCLQSGKHREQSEGGPCHQQICICDRRCNNLRVTSI